MSDYAQNDPTGPASLAGVGDVGLGEGDVNTDDPNWVDPDADSNTDLMRPDSDPLPDATVPGAGPDGQAPTTPEV